MANKNQGSDIEKAPQGGDVAVARDPMDVSTYRILNRSEEQIVKAMEVFQHNLRGQKLTDLDLPRVKVPPQGMTIWSIPSTEGDIHVEEITGILVEYTTPRAYWDKPMEPGSVTPPVCSSPDGVKGVGEPGIACHTCPFSKFGSDPREDSNGQACKEKRMLFLLRPDSLLPVVVQAPSTSIRNVFDYTMGLANELEMPFHHVLTKLTLEKVGNGGVEYSKVVLQNAGAVPEEYHNALESYRTGLANIVGTHGVDVIPDEETTQDGGDDNEKEPQGDGNGQDGEGAENEPVGAGSEG